MVLGSNHIYTRILSKDENPQFSEVLVHDQISSCSVANFCLYDIDGLLSSMLISPQFAVGSRHTQLKLGLTVASLRVQ